MAMEYSGKYMEYMGIPIGNGNTQEHMELHGTTWKRIELLS